MLSLCFKVNQWRIDSAFFAIVCFSCFILLHQYAFNLPRWVVVPEYDARHEWMSLHSSVHYHPPQSLTDCAPLPLKKGQMLPRLELSHIPKTGGSALEALAAEHNITWGSCHWMSSVEGRPCPDHPQRPAWDTKNRISFWHIPVGYINSSFFFDPYENATIFAIVRDPYSKVVSAWNYERNDVTLMGLERNNPQHMNQFLQDMIKRIENKTLGDRAYSWCDGHFIPQYRYITNRDMILIRHENIQEEFSCLMKKYHMAHLILPKQHLNSRVGKLMVDDLTDETVDLIEHVYAKDFKLLRYPKRPRRKMPLATNRQ